QAHSPIPRRLRPPAFPTYKSRAEILYGGLMTAPGERLKIATGPRTGSDRGIRAKGRWLQPTLKDVIPAVETTWVIVAAVLVMFMQAGFLLLEIGFSRMKNAGTIVPKVLANFS